MIKLVLSNYNLFSKLSKLKVISSFVTFNLRYLDRVIDPSHFSAIIDEIQLPNGSFKTTKPGRFSDIDRTLIELFGKGDSYEIHDVAVSDGITSVELYDLLNRHNINFNITISDKYSFIYCEKKWWGAKYYSSQKDFIFADFFIFRACSYLSNRYLFSRLLGEIIQRATSSKPIYTRVLLLNPKAKKMIDNRTIRFIEYDLFGCEQLDNKYDFVRCMNILNPRYFTVEMLRGAIKNLIKSLTPNGVLQIGRTDIQSGFNQVSFYRREEGRLVVVNRTNGGSEIDELIEYMDTE